MNYTQEIEAWFRERFGAFSLENEEERKEVLNAVKEKLLESYRNGQKDCPNCNPKARRARRLTKPPAAVK